MKATEGLYDDAQHPHSHPRRERSPTPPPPDLANGFPGPPVVLASAYPPPPEVLPPPHLLPELPSGQRQPIWHNDPRIPYTLTTHIVPAAYWREDPDVDLPSTVQEGGNLSKEERQRSARDGEARLLEIRRELEAEAVSRTKEGKPRRGQQRVLWLCFNRYVRIPNIQAKKDDLTLFFAHANGFNKETWEPTLAALLSLPTSQCSIQEVWVWEAANHGDSALLNQGNLNSLFHWRNAARDLLTFFTHYLPPKTSTDVLPTHLPRLSQCETAGRLKHGFYDSNVGVKTRTIIGIGHSFGGCVSTLASISSPSDSDEDPINNDHPNSLARGAFGRRSTWNSREAAKGAFLKSEFFRRWDTRVLDLYVEEGLVESEVPVKQVRLKMPPLHEAIAFSDTRTGSEEAWVRLWRGELKAKDVGLKWVVPGVGQKELGVTAYSTRTRVWLRPENSENVRMAGAGHLVPHEKPNELGHLIGRWTEEYLSVTGRKAKL
ncbi:hypothetical protein E1B28_006584 [Marasmius oreades]|uniref:AB hydrolase-1 domain-containing protein n=1 Tax=Marasmius oreades TaxID=181124 RepID=A0A9P7UWF3_9AGAR|nr:uncharacterized protein E1B28_006584 [Marasmius oreades]KAG7095897.1 hypothetical protein E1B28_006584 [Marasmius oreades]